MDFECHPSDVETVMHERNDIMTKVSNMRFKQISQHCAWCFSGNFDEISKKVEVGDTLIKTKISLLVQARHG